MDKEAQRRTRWNDYCSNYRKRKNREYKDMKEEIKQLKAKIYELNENNVENNDIKVAIINMNKEHMKLKNDYNILQTENTKMKAIIGKIDCYMNK